MRDHEEKKLDAFDMQEEMEFKIVKALHINGKKVSSDCPVCNYWMQAVPREKGITWVCGNIEECGYTEFEEVKK